MNQILKESAKLKDTKYDDIQAGEKITWNRIKSERFGELLITDNLLNKIVAELFVATRKAGSGEV